MRVRLRLAAVIGACLLVSSVPPADAGVTNPDISVIGQPLARVTDDAFAAARKRVTFDPGEAEVMADAYLNPYARGTFIFSFADGAVDVEEGYFSMNRGLPLGLALKGGKYRAGFGKLNIQHPHAVPFAERFHVLADYLPGTESFSETGLQLSRQWALPGDVALTASADWLQGDSFRRERAPSGAANDPLTALVSASAANTGPDRANEPRPAGLGRLSAFIPAGDRSGIELGASYTQGTNNVAAATRTSVWGGDVKAKLWRNANSYVVVQGEVLGLNREDAAWDSTAARFAHASVKPVGGYVFADYNFNPKYDAGFGYEHWQSADAAKLANQSIRAFVGLALMEETTVFRLDWEHTMPGTPAGAPEPDAVNTVTMRVIYSMGPHKAHQF